MHCKAVNEDPECLLAWKQAFRLKSKTTTSQRLPQGRYSVAYVKQYLGRAEQPSSSRHIDFARADWLKFDSWQARFWWKAAVN